MPYKSDKQRAYMHANMPEMAKEWDMKYPERGQRTKTNQKKRKTDPRADHMRKTSASNSGGSSVGGGT